MVDVYNERLVAIRDVPKLLPKRPSGRPVHVSAVYRWVSRGVQGAKLEAVRIGGTLYTSVEAIQRFAVVKDSPANNQFQHSSRISPRRQEEIENATRRVQTILKLRTSQK